MNEKSQNWRKNSTTEHEREYRGDTKGGAAFAPEFRRFVESPPHPELPKGRTRESILHSAKDCVCGARNEDYGTPEDNFSRIADLWRIYIMGRCVAQNVHVELNAEDVAAMMCLLKIGRIAGGSESIDNWVDIAGYAACGGEIMSGGDSNACVGD